MTAIDDRIRSAARRVVAECANVRAGEHVYLEGRMDAAEYLELLAFECERARRDGLRRAAQRRPRAPPAPRAAGRPARTDVARPARGGARRRRRLRRAHGARRPGALRRRLAGAGRRRRPRPQAALRPLLRREPALDRHRLPDPRPGGGLRSRLRRLQRHVLAQPRRRLRGAASARPTCWPPRSPAPSQVRITSPKGTDVTLGIAGRPLDKDVGVVGRETNLSNLPAGEVCLAPLEDQSEGTVVFDLAFMDGRRVEDLEVRFEAGRGDAGRRGPGVRVRAAGRRRRRSPERT